MPRPQLSDRALARATLARQLLLERSAMSCFDAIEWLVGLQGQAPLAPYVGLWSRLADFDPASLAGMLLERDAVRMPLMRATIHLVTARDARVLRPLVQPVLARAFAGSPFDIGGADPDTLRAAGREALATPRTRPELGRELAPRWPGVDPESLAQAVTYLEPAVQVTPRGVWGSGGAARWTTLERWLGDPAAGAADLEGATRGAADLDALVLRYLAAFGPASIADVQLWSGLTRLAEVMRRLAPRLVQLSDERGSELYDLPDAPRPDPETPAPPRLLPEYDNLLLSHADRRRFIDDGVRVPLPPGNGARRGTVLLDGRLTGTWQFDSDARVMTVAPRALLGAVSAPARIDAALSAEAGRLAAWLLPGGPAAEVRIT